MQYRTKDGEMLDEILWRIFDTTNKQVLEKTLLLNPGLADYGPTLPPGLLLELPEKPLKDVTASSPILYA